MPKVTIFEGTMDEVINYTRFVNRPYQSDQNRRGSYKGNRGRRNQPNPNLKVSSNNSIFKKQ